MQKRLNRRRSGALAGLVVGLVTLGLVALGVVGGDDATDREREVQPVATAEPTTTAAPATAAAPGTSPSPSTATSVPPAGEPEAPWRAAPLPRSEVPTEFLDAWGRAENRSTCALLVPGDAGPALEGATAGWSPVHGDAGWDIRLRRGPAIVEILGLFETAEPPDGANRAPFSRSWPDGSVARYGPDTPGGLGAGEVDPEASANEAVLTIPGQACAYRIYDTLGKSHLEFVLEHLRFVEGAP